MEKQISISFGNVIAHLVPGLLGMLILGFEFPDFSFPKWIADNVVLLTTGFLSLALAFGLLLDSFRYLVIRVVSFIPVLKKQYRFQGFPPKGHVEQYNWIIENYYRHHQFCGNLALASALLFMIPEKISLCISIALTSILTVSAFFMYLRTVSALNEAFPKN